MLRNTVSMVAALQSAHILVSASFSSAQEGAEVKPWAWRWVQAAVGPGRPYDWKRGQAQNKAKASISLLPRWKSPLVVVVRR